MDIISILVFLLILTVIVFIHELGHFLAAKKFKVRVEEFAIGMPPRAISKRIGETEYTFNWLPIGGYVKLKGEDYNDYSPKDPNNLINKTPLQKGIIIVAGVFMNFLLSIIIFYVLLAAKGFKTDPILLVNDYSFAFGKSINLPSIVTFIQKDSPAEKAGIKFGDRIVKLESEGKVISPESIEEAKAFYKDKQNKEVKIYTINIQTNESKTYTLIPTYMEKIKQAGIGVGLNNAVIVSYEGIDKVLAGVLHGINLTLYSFDMLKNLISASFAQKDLSIVGEGVSGPIGVYGAVKAVIDTGGAKVVLALLELSALISLSLGIMNLLPIPALDGGRLMFIIYEGITGKRVKENIEAKLIQYGFFFLIALIILITFKDIWQLF